MGSPSSCLRQRGGEIRLSPGIFPQSMAVDERLAVMGMIVAAVNVTDPGVGKLVPWNDLTELEQETHLLVTKIAYRVMGVLDQHGAPP